MLPAPSLTLTENAWMTLHAHSGYSSGTDPATWSLRRVSRITFRSSFHISKISDQLSSLGEMDLEFPILSLPLYTLLDRGLAPILS